MKKIHDLLTSGETTEVLGGGLLSEFGGMPFSVFDARQGWWQTRKKAWLSLGIKSELGRGENLLKFSDTALDGNKLSRAGDSAYVPQTGVKRHAHRAIPGGGTGKNSVWLFKTKEGYVSASKQKSGRLTFGTSKMPSALNTLSGTSIFDPVLCELVYRWFVPQGGTILDPFAGGSVRGLIAAMLGYRYCGIDLSGEQVEANKTQAAALLSEDKPFPKWIQGDSTEVVSLSGGKRVDAIFTCPPYADLEVYSDHPKDISGMSYADFAKTFSRIIENSCGLLKNNRFACVVIGDVRDKKTGFYRGLPALTTEIFEKAGLHLYNTAILLTSVGSLAMRTRRMFNASRKLGTTHQYVLVYVKGDPLKAVKALGGFLND